MKKSSFPKIKTAGKSSFRLFPWPDSAKNVGNHHCHSHPKCPQPPRYLTYRDTNAANLCKMWCRCLLFCRGSVQLMASDTKLHFGRRIRGEDKGHNTKGRHREPISFGIISGSYKSGMHVPSCGRVGVGLGLAFVSLWDAFVINCFSFGSMWDQLPFFGFWSFHP